MAMHDSTQNDRRTGADTPRISRDNWFRTMADRFHKRAMDITLLLFKGRAGIVFTALEVLYFSLVFHFIAQNGIDPVQIFFAILLNILLVGLFICLLSRAVFATFQQESRLTEAAIQEAIHRSELDSLTGLYDRTSLYRELSARIRHARRTGTPLSIILFDLDEFKDINDAHGHAVGDECIATLSQMLRDRVRGTELAARYGGEEFVLVLPGTPLAGAAARADISRQRVAEKVFDDHGNPFSLTVSAGVAQWEDGMDAAALIDLADKRMYEAKESGRDRVCAGEGPLPEALPVPDTAAEGPQLTRPPEQKRKRSAVEDPGSKQEVFLLLVQQCLYGIGLWLPLTLFLSRSIPAFLGYSVTGIALFIVYRFLRGTHSPGTMTRLYLFYIFSSLFVFLPEMYLFCGGLASGVPVLFILLATAITLLMNGPAAGITLGLLIAVFAAVIGLDLGHVGVVSGFTELGDLSHFYTLATIIFVGVTLSRIMRMLYRNYQENRKFSEELMQQLKTTSLVDPLSGAFDRRFLLDYLDESIRLAEAGDLPVFSVLMFDLDHFKQINDHYGHLMGDACIRELGHLVKENLRENDALIRYGGEEFICVLRGASDYTAVRRAEQIRAKVSETNLVPDLREPVTLSCGVVMYRPGMTADDLIREADTQLYRAKRRGRNRVSCRGSRGNDNN
ncbi:MAG: diguanylate cyclase [Clostridia bacterium]|nr:diguanylate cyclase [Clostridia bacterium]